MPVSDPAERVDLPMVCTCSAEGAAAGDALYERVKERLSHGSEHLRARTVTDRTLLEDLLLSLHADHAATVEQILYDQWAVIMVEAGPSGEELQVVVPCDEVILGLAAVWEWFEHRSTDEAP